MVQHCYVKFIPDVNLFIFKDTNAIVLNWEYYKIIVFILAHVCMLPCLFQVDQMSCVLVLIKK